MLEQIIFTPLDILRLDLDRQKIIEFCDERKYRHIDWMRTDIKNYSEPLNKDFKSLFPNAEFILRSLPFEDFDNSSNILNILETSNSRSIFPASGSSLCWATLYQNSSSLEA